MGNEPTHYLFGLEVTDSDPSMIMNEAITTARHFLAADEIVDFIKIDKLGELGKYLLQQTKPFYQQP